MPSIYLVGDMENDLVHADGPNGKSAGGEQVKSRGIVAKTQAAIARARAAGVKIAFVRVGFSPDYKECPPNSPVFSGARKNGMFKLGTWGTEIHPELTVKPEDFQVVKHRVSPFYATNFEAILRANGITRIYVSGFSTNGVVHAAVREGHDRDYEIVVLEDCCAAGSADEHAMALATFKRYCNAVTASTEIEFA